MAIVCGYIYDSEADDPAAGIVHALLSRACPMIGYARCAERLRTNSKRLLAESYPKSWRFNSLPWMSISP